MYLQNNEHIEIRDVFSEIADRMILNEEFDKLEQIKKYWGCDLSECKSIKKMPFYDEYLAKFENVQCDYVKPFYSLYGNDLLFRLIAGSYSSSWGFEFQEKTGDFRLFIRVSAGNKAVTKYLDDLCSFQIKKMYRIYLEEQINMALLMYDDHYDANRIHDSRKKIIDRFYEQTDECFRKKLYTILKGE